MTRVFVAMLTLGFIVGCETTDQTTLGPDTEMKLGPDEHVTHAAEDIPWQAGPASFEEGAEMAVLEGDPAEEGMFTMRLRVPSGFVIAPHWHPNYERVSVLSGTFHLGHGDTVDSNATERLEAGSYTVMPPGMRHFAIAEGQTVIQITTMGPWEINYIDPADDPRQR
ncbi:MAG: cupin domain-containing protein [Phycisphaeraceae bacterium]